MAVFSCLLPDSASLFVQMLNLAHFGSPCMLKLLQKQTTQTAQLSKPGVQWDHHSKAIVCKSTSLLISQTPSRAVE
jgi:hypothetical protein